MKLSKFKGKMKAKVWLIKYRVGTSIWFLKLSWLAIKNKIIIINSREVCSNGGFKYLQVNISVRPLNKEADYSKIK